MAVIDENNQADNVPLASLHWSALKKMVEEAGGKYEGKEQAIAFLSGNAGGNDEQGDANDPNPVVLSEGVGVMFDKSQPHGVVCGEIEDAPGARYFQNGSYFNAKGEKVG